MVAHERRRVLVETEEIEQCDEQRVDVLLELSSHSPTQARRTNWAAGVRWIVALSVIGWLIVLSAVLLVWLRPR